MAEQESYVFAVLFKVNGIQGHRTKLQLFIATKYVSFQGSPKHNLIPDSAPPVSEHKPGQPDVLFYVCPLLENMIQNPGLEGVATRRFVLLGDLSLAARQRGRAVEDRGD